MYIPDDSVPIEYNQFFLPKPVADAAFIHLVNTLDWVHKDPLVPRREYYVHDGGLDYTYGTGQFARTYQSQAPDPVITMIRRLLLADLGVDFDVVFLNIYDHQHHHLGWHPDDSPTMSPNHPIVTVSLGEERDIKIRPIADKQDVTTKRLHHGSACVMLPGMQQTHHHRIPKHDRECGARASLTFRKFVYL
ncbi:hypothetical protein D3C73_1013900 [compost metagenome]